MFVVRSCECSIVLSSASLFLNSLSNTSQSQSSISASLSILVDCGGARLHPFTPRRQVWNNELVSTADDYIIVAVFVLGPGKSKNLSEFRFVVGHFC